MKLSSENEKFKEKVKNTEKEAYLYVTYFYGLSLAVAAWLKHFAACPIEFDSFNLKSLAKVRSNALGKTKQNC
jgi:hypothetical protein